MKTAHLVIVLEPMLTCMIFFIYALVNFNSILKVAVSTFFSTQLAIKIQLIA